MSSLRLWCLAALSFLFLACDPQSTLDGDAQYDAVLWQDVTLSFEGPILSEERQTFTDYRFDVIFTHEDGEILLRPGYFTASADPAEDSANAGTVWQVKFVPTQPGQWQYETRFTEGPNVAFAQSTLEDSAGYFDGQTGTISVAAADLNSKATDFAKRGLLQDVRQRYLKFSGIGEYFLKTGAGSPENLLAYADFDGTYDAGGTNFPALGDNQLHEFEPHQRDAQPGDPTWQDGKGAAILGIANYYETVGVNAQYIVTMNIEGDGQDVFPYVSHTDPYVFDVSKLAQWQRVLEHYNSRGVLIDMLLTETENESWFEAMDGAEIGQDFADSRKLYYREMVARFGHLNGLVFNLGEENGVVGNSGQDPYRQPTTAKQRLAFAKYISDLDAYDHAIVSHNWPNSEEETYGPKLGIDHFSGISMQVHEDYFEKVANWIALSASTARPWMINVDEPLGWEFGARPDEDVGSCQREIEGVLWPTFMGGGAGVDWYFGWQNNAPTSDLSNEDQRTRHNLWLASTKVRRFFEQNFDLASLKSNANGDFTEITLSGLDNNGAVFKLTATRELPIKKKGNSHRPSGFKMLSLTLEREGKVIKLDPMNPSIE